MPYKKDNLNELIAEVLLQEEKGIVKDRKLLQLVRGVCGMMPMLSEYDKKMIEETDKWIYLGEDGLHHLREDAPPEIKRHHKKIKDLYSMFE